MTPEDTAALDRALVIHYRLRVLKAAQAALAIPRGPTAEALVRIARRERVEAAEIRAVLEKIT
jgi:hypothetical protein